MSLTIDVDLPRGLRSPSLTRPAVAARLDALLDRQDAGHALIVDERGEAEGLVDLAKMLSLLRLRAERESDHVDPIAAGGPTTFENLALACVSCSLREGAMTLATNPWTSAQSRAFTRVSNVGPITFGGTARPSSR